MELGQDGDGVRARSRRQLLRGLGHPVRGTLKGEVGEIYRRHLYTLLCVGGSRVWARTGSLTGYKWFRSHVTFCYTQKVRPPLPCCANGTGGGATHLARGLRSARINKRVHGKNPPARRQPTWQSWVVPWSPHTSFLPVFHPPGSTPQHPSPEGRKVRAVAAGDSCGRDPGAAVEPSQPTASCRPAVGVRKTSNQES